MMEQTMISATTVDDKPAADEISETAPQHQPPLVLVALGALESVGGAVGKLTNCERLRDVCWMAGVGRKAGGGGDGIALGDGGGATPLQGNSQHLIGQRVLSHKMSRAEKTRLFVQTIAIHAGWM